MGVWCGGKGLQSLNGGRGRVVQAALLSLCNRNNWKEGARASPRTPQKGAFEFRHRFQYFTYRGFVWLQPQLAAACRGGASEGAAAAVVTRDLLQQVYCELVNLS